jgi:hypothetical protein
LLLSLLLTKIASSIFVHSSRHVAANSLGVGAGLWWQDVSYCFTIVFSLCLSQLTWNLLTISMKNSGQSRGQTVFLYSTCGTLGVLVMDKLGGDLSINDPTAPFLVTLAQCAILTIVLLVLGFCKKSLHH